MSEVAIRAVGLGKLYRIGQRQKYKALRDSLAQVLRWPRLRAQPRRRDGNDAVSRSIWALQDVSFEIERGEVVGVIGRNGAGKSTLLRILSRITDPTRGHAEIHGRMGSLLEVGTGFHPELTGRENTYLNGAILGMSRREVNRKFDEIVAFAEMEQFVDTPVKYYSTGMYLRLAFAVAAHLDAEILLVDEVLAVGDAAFQRKCLGKMRDVARAGRTALFVSHNMEAIARLCSQSIWLDGGMVAYQGPSVDVVKRYQARYLTVASVWTRPSGLAEGQSVGFLRVEARDEQGNATGVFRANQSVGVEILYRVNRPLTGCQIGVRLYNSSGLVVLTTADVDGQTVTATSREPGLYRASFSIPANLLAPGSYYFLIAAHLPMREVYEEIEQAITFEVSDIGAVGSGDGRLGVIQPSIRWTTRKERSS